MGCHGSADLMRDAKPIITVKYVTVIPPPDPTYMPTEPDKVEDFAKGLRNKDCDFLSCLREINTFTHDELLRLSASLHKQDEARLYRGKHSASAAMI